MCTLGKSLNAIVNSIKDFSVNFIIALPRVYSLRFTQIVLSIPFPDEDEFLMLKFPSISVFISREVALRPPDSHVTSFPSLHLGKLIV